MSYPTIPERVKNGVRLLDAKVPNWREKIDLERLDINSQGFDEDGDACVLAQVFGYYSDGVDELDLNHNVGYRVKEKNNGFWPTGNDPAEIELLNTEWTKAIKDESYSTAKSG